MTALDIRCCIAGGGPAGMMLGLLLARAGVDVVVLEKHADFLRDFRGDTIHPSTLELMVELGLIDAFLARPHQQVRRLSGIVGDTPVGIADFTHLPTRCKFIALMPQWDFLDFISDRARRYRTFDLRMQTEATALIEEEGRITGLRANTRDGEIVIRADLVVGADGRHSTVRQCAGLSVEDIGAPIDVLWMRLKRLPSDIAEPLGRIGPGSMFVMIDRGDYWQCALVIRKGGYDAIRRGGLEELRRRIAVAAPDLRERLSELDDWDKIKLLTVTVDRLRQWSRPGLICIGDAAHAMSPVGGVGVNLAVQDAVAAANILAAPLREGRVTSEHLQAVQRRRMFPTRATQWMQVAIQNNVISRVLGSDKPVSPPWQVRQLGRCPQLQRIPARIVGVGFRPEHIHTPELAGTALP
jgi:2-polyprenyl-6-methoxyphenol hydroxylase-like FAD-dependent oxidoreductase